MLQYATGWKFSTPNFSQRLHRKKMLRSTESETVDRIMTSKMESRTPPGI